MDKPWVVCAEDEERARRKAEGLEREKRGREERKRRKRWVEVGGRGGGLEKGKRRGERKGGGGEERLGLDEAGVSRRTRDAERKSRR